ncbi:glycosyl hydrolase [Mycena sp. CBHHK59/15]|nr:glycosyl hydrolase [Mycena sp. CBHHK59/15]
MFKWLVLSLLIVGQVFGATFTNPIGLKTATPKLVWSDTTSTRCCNMWAPEIHKMMDGAWYIQATSPPVRHRPASLDSTFSVSRDLRQFVVPNHNTPGALDPSILAYNGAYYLVYSQWDNSLGGQSLFLGKMSGPTTVGAVTAISVPTYSWEKAGADPTVASSWTKKSTPIFTGANGNNEPGHSGFFLSAGGDQVWNVFHASSTIPSVCDGSRYTMVQPVTWNSDGSPNLGSPDALSVAITEPDTTAGSTGGGTFGGHLARHLRLHHRKVWPVRRFWLHRLHDVRRGLHLHVLEHLLLPVPLKTRAWRGGCWNGWGSKYGSV